MNLISRLAVVLVLCLIAIALPSLPAQAQCGGPVIELSPRYGLPGTRVTIYGHYFTGDKLVDIYYDGTLVVTNVRTGSGGDLAYTLNIPEGCGGPYQVLAEG
jgi:hypothetical protein